MIRKISLAACVVMVAACADNEQSVTPPLSEADAASSTSVVVSTSIDQSALVNAVGNESEWLTYNRTYKGQRFSPNQQINTNNVGQLGLAWYADMDTSRGQEATPLVIDGGLYTTTAWSKVKAYNARNGELLWEYDPEVPGETGVKGCCDVVNRGLAAWGEKLFLGTFDGRLVALDRATGKPDWIVDTKEGGWPYTITGAPLVVNGKVIIGNGGAEFGVRGFVSAYDAETGEMLWRFYTVPDNPANGPQPEYLEEAAKTWNGEWWKLGGGGTVWDSVAYDPELDLLYIGVGNGSPWNQAIRSPGGGDNLYLSSIVAIRPNTGEYVWHFQTTPGETWDYTATQHIMLADLTINGELRKVLMQAPKNGFFYVLDRATGEFISANNYAPMNWASGVDENGRPLELLDARYDKTGKPVIVTPGASGAHSWHPMAFHPDEGLVYIPAIISALPYVPATDGFKATIQGFNTGVDFGAAAMPADNAVRKAAQEATNGALIAWDPVTQQERWRVDYPTPGNGGVLATAGGLVFEGTAATDFVAYSAKDGSKLWSFPAQTGVVAAPISYILDGEQYIAVMAGWGGIWALAPGGYLSEEAGPVRNVSRLLVFKLKGSAKLPPAPSVNDLPLNPPPVTADKETLAEGRALFGSYCAICHGDAAVGGGLLPDLRRSPMALTAESWKTVVYDGALTSRGMVAWNNVMNAEQVETIRHYVILRANEDKALESQQ